MGIGERLKQLIDERNLTTFEVYTNSGVSESSINRIIRKDNVNIGKKNLELFSKYFKVNPTWLKTGKGEQQKGTDIPSASSYQNDHCTSVKKVS